MKMKIKNQFKEVDIKNRAYYYFGDIINGADINFSNILLNKKLCEYISVYETSYRTYNGSKTIAY